MAASDHRYYQKLRKDPAELERLAMEEAMQAKHIAELERDRERQVLRLEAMDKRLAQDDSAS